MFGNLTPVVRNLLLINIVVYFIDYLMNGLPSHYLSFYGYMSDRFAPYQLFTYMFLHGGFMHLLSNMFGLFFFGPMLERFWGSQRFLQFYLITGVGAGVIYSLVNLYESKALENQANNYVQSPTPEAFVSFLRDHYPNYSLNDDVMYTLESLAEDPDNRRYQQRSINVVREVFELNINIGMLGASGAIFGILLAFGMLFPNTELFLLFPPMPIKAKYVVAFYGLYTIYALIEQAPGDSVAHFAHLGGMVVAFVLIKIWQSDRDKFY